MNANALLIRRGIQRGMTTLSRDRGWLPGFLGLTGILLFMQFMVVTLLALQAAGHLLVTGSALHLEVQRTASPQNVQEFMVAAKDLPEVERVEYVTKEQAYERERLRAGELIGFLEEFKIANPFPDTVSVTLASLDDVDAFSAFVRKPEWSRVVDLASLSAVGDQEKDIARMRALTSSLQVLGAGLTILLLIVCGAFITEFVRRRAMERSDEILVERVSGAPFFSTLLPFIAESSILLIAAAALAGLVLAALALSMPVFAPGLVADGSLSGLRGETSRMIVLWSMPIALLEAIVLVGLSAAGSWLAIRTPEQGGK